MKLKNNRWPGFISPQLATLVEVPPDTEEWVHEIKFDGYRLQAHIRSKSIKLYTRAGNDWSRKFPSLISSLLKLNIESAIMDGEAVVMDSEGVSHFGSLQDALSKKDDSAIRIYFFDLLYLNGSDLRGYPLSERKALLKKLLPKKSQKIFYSEDVEQNGAAFFKKACDYKLEGIISKKPDAPYVSGRSHLWFKSKCAKRQEFVIGGFSEGRGGRRNVLGALLLGVYEDHNQKRLFRYVGKVGTGFNHQILEELTKKIKKQEIKKSPFDLNSPKEKGIHWLKPKLVAEVKFSEWTKDKILRTPVYLGLKEDVMTHPQKILFPNEGITKEMIAEYYEEVARWILPHISDRPLSLVRCPNGADKKCFFQKHLETEEMTKNFKTFEVKEKKGSSQYLAISSREGLRQIVQMNAFELHTWNTHYQNLMTPDQIILDFDPDPNVKFSEVVVACKEMKKILDQLKLKSFVKLSGGKGLHIHIPVEPLYSWDQIKAFSKALAFELVDRNPKKYIATMSKKNRKGKIFIDYFRNTFGATAVAPYSLRAREVSSVALPVEWSEISRIKSGDQFTLKKALLKIKKRPGDPWSKFISLKQKITILE